MASKKKPKGSSPKQKKTERKVQAKRPVGRPSVYSQKLADRICTLLIEGNSLRKICRKNGMPGLRTVCSWLATNREFQQHYARAREFQAELGADEIVDVADESYDKIAGNKGDSARVQAYRLKVEARKWVASKLLPKKYGDRPDADEKGIDALDRLTEQMDKAYAQRSEQ